MAPAPPRRDGGRGGPEIVTAARDNASAFCGVQIKSANKLLPPRGWLCPRRAPDEDEFLYVRRGRGELAIGERTYPIRRHQLYILKRGVPYLIRAASDHTVEHWRIHFLLLDCRGNPLALDALGLPDTVPIPGQRSFERLFLECVHHALSGDPDRRAALLAAFFALLDRVLHAGGILPSPDSLRAEERKRESGNGGEKMRHTDQVMAAIEWMMERLSGDVTLEELAARARMSPSHFEKVFKRVAGSTPHSYYVGLKLERAKTLLVSADCTLTEIAARLGFGSLHHFSRSFKRYEGEPPSSYARRARAQEPAPETAE